MRIEVVAYGHPDAQDLIEQVQQEYVVRYGERDVTPVDAAEFEPPRGLFLVGYLEERPVGAGGWRSCDGSGPELRDGDAELKRMYIVPEARGRGLAREMLTELERTAARAGRRRFVLETGAHQPEAIALYQTSGYHEINGFGAYRNDPLAIHFAKEL